MQRRSARLASREKHSNRTEESQSTVGLPMIKSSGRYKPLSTNMPAKLLLPMRQSEPKKYFYFDSEDEYIRKILLEQSWTQCKSEDIRKVKLVWVYNPDKYSSAFHEAAEKVNHFRSNYALTTKDGLRSTLYQHAPAEIKVSRFYPRTYDMHSEFEEFEMDFNRTAMLNLLRKYLVYIETAAVSQPKQPKVSLEQLLKQGWQGWAGKLRKDFLFPKSIFLQSLIWFENLKNKVEVSEHTQTPEYYITEQTEDQLVEFSRIDPPYHTHFGDDVDEWVTPSSSAVELVRQFARFFEENMPHYRSDGFSNIWVVKPSESSKGRNLHLIDSKESLKRHIHSSRIVQKYIENIWVFTERELEHYPHGSPNEDLRRLLNKKFDIRLWVLVTSFQPLVVYLHEEAYLRLTSDDYAFGSLSNHCEHLTNYAINKHKAPQSNSFVLLSVLEEHLRRVYDYSRLRPSLEKLIVETLMCAQHQISQSSNSFELFGFDVILDCDLNPWLLEVNMSPACRERGALKTLLRSMGEGLLGIIGAIPAAQSACAGGWKMIYTEQCLHNDRIREDFVVAGKSLALASFEVHQQYSRNMEALTLIQRFVKQNKRKRQLSRTDTKMARSIHLIAVLAKITKISQQRIGFSNVLQHRRKKRKYVQRKNIATVPSKFLPIRCE